MINRSEKLALYKKQQNKRTLKLTMSSSILASMVAVSAFGEAVQAEEIDLNKEDIQALYDQYNELQSTVNDQASDGNSTEDTDIPVLTEAEKEEMAFVRSQLIKMIELAGGTALVEQLNVDQLSSSELDAVFETLLTYQLEQAESNSAVKAVETEAVEHTEEKPTEDAAAEETTEVSEEKTEENISDPVKKTEEKTTQELGSKETADTTNAIENTEAELEKETDQSENVQVTSSPDDDETIEPVNSAPIESARAASVKVAGSQEESAADESKSDQENSAETITEIDAKNDSELDAETTEKETDKAAETAVNTEDEAEETAKETNSSNQSAETVSKDKTEQVTETETVKKTEKTETQKTDAEITENKKAETQKAETKETKTEEKAIVHTVKSGDTLNKISKQYGTTVSKIVSLNKLASANLIKVGQKLAINTAGLEAAASNTGNLNKAQSAEDFINQISGRAQTVAKENGIYASIMIAQASLESGYGKSQLASPPNHNLFGIKGEYEGQSVAMRTREYYESTGWITITDYFKKYPSYTESLQDNARLIRRGTSWNNEYYAGAWVENTSSYRDASAWLQGRYATDPTYASKLNNLIELYDLTRYDGVIPDTGNETAPSKPVNPSKPAQPATPPTEQTDGINYKVVSGDTLSGIARRYNTTVSAIKSANKLKSDMIFINQTLLIPGSLSEAEDDKVTEPSSPSTPETKPEAGQSAYKVRSGDTLSGIARKYKTTVSAIKSANNLKSDMIYVNQTLQIPGKAAETAPSESQQPEAKPDTSKTTYKVKAGDTLSGIARRYKTTVSAIKSANKLKSDMIYVGQTLKLTDHLSDTDENETTAPEKEQETTQSSYQVKSGDTLSGIARKFSTTVSAIKKANNLTSDLIFANQKLAIPGKTGENASAGNTETSKPDNSETAKETRYTVKVGDTLSGIARRFNTTVSAIKSTNQLKTDLIFVNQTLSINGTVVSADPVETTKPSEEAKVTGTHKVKAGDTLSGIARSYNTTVAKLKSDNQLKSDLIFVGQTLKVSGKAESVKETENKTDSETAQPKGKITVEPGNTLSGLAKTYNSTVAALKSANGLKSDLIFVGQTLSVPQAENQTQKTDKQVSSEPSEKEDSHNTAVNYTVVSGDSLYKIALDYQTSVAKLKEWNKLESDTIYIGQKLTVGQAAESNKTIKDKPNAEQTDLTKNQYRVVSGDTLSGIARKFNTTIQQLKEKNKLSSDLIFVDQLLSL